MVEEARFEALHVTVDSSLEDLVAEHYESLFRLAVLVCREQADAQDAVQEALERAWRHQGAVRDRTQLRAWLHRIVVREAFRIEGRRRGLLSRLLRPPLEIAGGVARGDARDLDLRKALEALPVGQRAALVLHYYAGYSIAETATLCGIPLETARSRLRLARARLRAELGELNEQ